eukprot:4422664-Prymnesium_polylepis.1
MPSKAILLDACLSLLNSKAPEQRERGIAILQAGDFSQPDNIKVRSSCLPPRQMTHLTASPPVAAHGFAARLPQASHH